MPQQQCAWEHASKHMGQTAQSTAVPSDLPNAMQLLSKSCSLQPVFDELPNLFELSGTTGFESTGVMKYGLLIPPWEGDLFPYLGYLRPPRVLTYSEL